MDNRTNKTSICSVVFLDIIDYSKKPDSEQIDVKNQFNNLINNSLKDVAEDDRIILDTGDGAAIAHMGSPEDALFVALAIRDAILKSNILSATPLYVRFGINLGPIRVVSDINGQPNIIGDGINVAQRIMSFANPNQILVSRSYHEITSRLTQEISQMFDYFGINHDKHMREHEVYSVRLGQDQATAKSQLTPLTDNLQSTEHLAFTNKINWHYVTPSLIILAVLFLLVKLISAPSAPSEPAIILAKPPISAEPTRKSNKKDEPTESAPKDTTAAAKKGKEKLTWKTFTDSVKHGTDRKCTQAEIAIGQCK